MSGELCCIRSLSSLSTNTRQLLYILLSDIIMYILYNFELNNIWLFSGNDPNIGRNFRVLRRGVIEYYRHDIRQLKIRSVPWSPSLLDARIPHKKPRHQSNYDRTSSVLRYISHVLVFAYVKTFRNKEKSSLVYWFNQKNCLQFFWIFIWVTNNYNFNLIFLQNAKIYFVK